MSVVSTSDLSEAISDSSSDDGIDSSSNDDAVLSDDSSDEDGLGDAKPSDDAVDEAGSDGDSGSDDVKASDDSADEGDGDSDDVKSSDDADDSSDESSDCKLTITKVGDKKVQVEDTVTWNITVKNTEGVAENVTVNESLPDDFEFVSAKASIGTYDKKLNSWDIGDLKESESANLTIVMKAKKAGNYTNTAEVCTDSNNLNKDNATVKADVEVVSKDKPDPVKPQPKEPKKEKKVKDQKNQTQTNNTNQTDKKVDLKKAGNPIMVILISIFVVFGLGVLKRQ